MASAGRGGVSPYHRVTASSRPADRRTGFSAAGSGVRSVFHALLEAVTHLFGSVGATLPLAPCNHYARCGHADEPRKSYDLPYLHAD